MIYYKNNFVTRWSWQNGQFNNGDFEKSIFEMGTFSGGNFFNSDFLTGDSTGGNFDNGGNFNTTSYKYTVPNTGLYDLCLQLDATFTYPFSLTTFFYAEFSVYKNGSFFATLPLFSSTITLPNLYNFNEIH